MNYYSSAFPVYASTDGIAYEIYLSGCNRHCKGCHNPGAQDFNSGKLLDSEMIDKLVDNINQYYEKELIDNICILGGEPLDQDINELSKFLKILNEKFGFCKIWLYTSYYMHEIPDEIIDLVDYIKCGAYIEERRSKDGRGFKTPYGVELITDNQYIVKVDEERRKNVKINNGWSIM